MKKIICGKTYNTSTAERLSIWESGSAYDDFGYYSESLFRKRNGEFFMLSDECGRSKYHSIRILPMTDEEAMSWAAGFCKNDLFEEIFGKIEKSKIYNQEPNDIENTVTELIHADSDALYFFNELSKKYTFLDEVFICKTFIEAGIQMALCISQKYEDKEYMTNLKKEIKESVKEGLFQGSLMKNENDWI